MKNRIINIKKIIKKYEIPHISKHIKLYMENNIQPSMGAIITGSDPGSISYMKGIENFCKKHNIDFIKKATNKKNELIKIIKKWNDDKNIDGFMIMYPTIFNDKDTLFMNMIKETKDLEGLTSNHLGYLVQHKKYKDPEKLRKLIIPPTAKGILYIFKKYYTIYENYYKKNNSYPDNLKKNPFKIEGKKITIINDSLAVGRSLGLMLLNENGSVRICHEYNSFEDILESVSISDFIISAVPSAEFKIPTKKIPKNSIVIDLSFNGNFKYPDIYNKVYKIAPKWKLVEKGNRINDITLYRLISNLFYLINLKLPINLIKKLQ